MKNLFLFNETLNNLLFRQKMLLTLSIVLVTWELHSQNFEWAKQLSGTAAENGQSVAVDASGNVYTTGSFEGTVDFDPGPGTYSLTSEGYRDIYIVKQDGDGNLVWVKQIGGDKPDRGISLALDHDGNVLTTGIFLDTVDFDPGAGVFPLSVEELYYGFNGVPYLEGFDIFILKLDGDGNFIWAKQFGGNLDDYGNAIIVDGSNNVITTGEFSNHYPADSADFDPGPGVFNMSRGGGFISKLDADGNFLWAKQFGYGTSAGSACGSVCVFYRDYSVEFRSVALDAAGNVYTTGSFIRINNDFDPGPSVYNLHALGARDIFVCRLDADGNFVWARQMGGSGATGQAEDIALDGTGNVHTTGSFTGKVDFNPGSGAFNLSSANPQGMHDVFVSKISNTGNFTWAKGFGSGADDRGSSIALDGLGNVYTTGWFSSKVDFDPGVAKYNLTASGVDDFISKLTSTGNFTWAVRLGGTGDDRGYNIAVDNGLNVYTTGIFTGTADFDPGAGVYNLIAAGSADAFVHKMTQTPILPLINTETTRSITSGFDFYPNPAKEKVTISFSAMDENQYEILLMDMNGRIINKYTGKSYYGINQKELFLGYVQGGMYQLHFRQSDACKVKLLFVN